MLALAHGGRAEEVALAAGLKLADFAELDAYQFYGDFHRTVYAGSLSLRGMSDRRRKVYDTLFAAFTDGAAQSELQKQYHSLFLIFSQLLAGNPDENFVIDFGGGRLIRSE